MFWVVRLAILNWTLPMSTNFSWLDCSTTLYFYYSRALLYSQSAKPATAFCLKPSTSPISYFCFSSLDSKDAPLLQLSPISH